MNMEEKTIALILIIILVLAVAVGANSYADKYGYYGQRGYGSMMGGIEGMGGNMMGSGMMGGGMMGSGMMGNRYSKDSFSSNGNVFTTQVLTARAGVLVLMEDPCGFICAVEAA